MTDAKNDHWAYRPLNAPPPPVLFSTKFGRQPFTQGNAGRNHNGANRRLTDVHGHVIQAILS